MTFAVVSSGARIGFATVAVMIVLAGLGARQLALSEQRADDEAREQGR